MQYYRFLSHSVNIVGEYNANTFAHQAGENDGRLKVLSMKEEMTGFSLTGYTNGPLFKDTKELRLYGLMGNDLFLN